MTIDQNQLCRKLACLGLLCWSSMYLYTLAYFESSMTNAPSNPQELRSELQQLTELQKGETTGQIELNADLNLNALAIGLGLENLEYDPETFPGLIYRHHQENSEDVTVVLFDDGRLTAVDAVDSETVQEAIIETVDRMRDLGLYMGDRPDTGAIEIQQNQTN